MIIEHFSIQHKQNLYCKIVHDGPRGLRQSKFMSKKQSFMDFHFFGVMHYETSVKIPIKVDR